MHENLKQAAALFAQNKVDQAEQAFLQVLASEPANKFALNNLGVIAYQKQDVERSVNYFEQVMEVDPFYKLALTNFVDVLKQINRIDLAKTHLTKYLASHPQDLEMNQALLELDPYFSPARKFPQMNEVLTHNDAGMRCLKEARLEEAKDHFVKSLAGRDDQPQIRELLLKTLFGILNRNADATKARLKEIKPKVFDKNQRRNPAREGFLRYVPEELVAEKTGKNVLFVSDIEVAGNMVRMMNVLNDHTTHKSRAMILKRDYLNYGEDLVLDNEESIKEAHELIKQADFFHFVRYIPPVPGLNWNDYLHKNNCLVDYFGGDIKSNKKQVVDFHQKTGIFGLNKYDHAMYRDAEFMMYHIPIMFDASPYRQYEVDLSFYDKKDVVINHAPTNPTEKYTHYILPILEKVQKRVPEKNLIVSLTMGKSNAEAMEEKANCDIHIDCIRPREIMLSGNPGLTSLESLALGKVTVCTLDNFFLSFFPDNPVFSATAEDLEDLMVNILTKPEMVREKMKNAKDWLKHYHPVEVMKQYLQIYQLVMTGNSFVNTFERFFMILD